MRSGVSYWWNLNLVASVMVAATVVLGSASYAHAECDGLRGADKEAYVDLSLRAVEAYTEKQYERAIELNLAARALCDDDRAVEYNLARAYDKAGRCQMAIYHYEEVLAVRKLPKSLKKKAKKHLKTAKKSCTEGARFTISCAQPGVLLDFDGSRIGCPFSGMTAPGVYEVTAEAPGFRSLKTEIQIRLDDQNNIRIPDLQSQSDFGVLSLTCSPGVNLVEIDGPEGQTQVACPYEGELLAGSYTVRAVNAEASIPVTIMRGAFVQSRLEVSRSAFEETGVVLGVSLAPGFGIAQGRLKDARGNDTGLDINAASDASLATWIRGGYAFAANWAALVVLRLDLNVGFLGGAVVRYTPWFNDLLALHVEAGLAGGGAELAATLTNNTSPTVSNGPFVFVLSGQLAFALTDTFSGVGGVTTTVGLINGPSPQFDLELGILARF